MKQPNIRIKTVQIQIGKT